MSIEQNQLREIPEKVDSIFFQKITKWVLKSSVIRGVLAAGALAGFIAVEHSFNTSNAYAYDSSAVTSSINNGKTEVQFNAVNNLVDDNEVRAQHDDRYRDPKYFIKQEGEKTNLLNRNPSELKQYIEDETARVGQIFKSLKAKVKDAEISGNVMATELFVKDSRAKLFLTDKGVTAYYFDADKGKIVHYQTKLALDSSFRDRNRDGKNDENGQPRLRGIWSPDDLVRVIKMDYVHPVTGEVVKDGYVIMDEECDNPVLPNGQIVEQAPAVATPVAQPATAPRSVAPAPGVHTQPPVNPGRNIAPPRQAPLVPAQPPMQQGPKITHVQSAPQPEKVCIPGEEKQTHKVGNMAPSQAPSQHPGEKKEVICVPVPVQEKPPIPTPTLPALPSVTPSPTPTQPSQPSQPGQPGQPNSPENPTPVPTNTPENTPSPTNTSEASPIPSQSPTPAATLENSPTASVTTGPGTPTNTPLPTSTPTEIPPQLPTAGPSLTPAATARASATPVVQITVIPTLGPVNSATPENTQAVPTLPPAATATAHPPQLPTSGPTLPPSATERASSTPATEPTAPKTATPRPAQATNTPVPPSATANKPQEPQSGPTLPPDATPRVEPTLQTPPTVLSTQPPSVPVPAATRGSESAGATPPPPTAPAMPPSSPAATAIGPSGVSFNLANTRYGRNVRIVSGRNLFEEGTY